jgi:hypothetical protein
MSSVYRLSILYSSGKLAQVHALQRTCAVAAVLFIFCSGVLAAERITPKSHVGRYFKADLVIFGEALSCTTKVVEEKDVSGDSGWIYHYRTFMTASTVRVDSVLKGSFADSTIVIQKESSQESRSRFARVTESGDSLHLGQIVPEIDDFFGVKIPCSESWIIFATEEDGIYSFMWRTRYERIALDVYKACAEEGEKVYEEYDLSGWEAVEKDSAWEYRLRRKAPDE